MPALRAFEKTKIPNREIRQIHEIDLKFPFAYFAWFAVKTSVFICVHPWLKTTARTAYFFSRNNFSACLKSSGSGAENFSGFCVRGWMKLNSFACSNTRGAA